MSRQASPAGLHGRFALSGFALHTPGAPVAQSVERWTCDWKIAGSNPGFEGPCRTISLISAVCVVPEFRKRHKTEVPDASSFKTVNIIVCIKTYTTTAIRVYPSV